MSVHSCRPWVQALAILFLLGASVDRAGAATWVVDSTSANAGLSACTAAPNDCSFPGAVSRLAAVGDSIVFTVASSEATEVGIAKDVVIDAAGARLPRLNIATSVGWATVTIRNAVWQDIQSGTPVGGAMRIAPQQIVTIEDSQFLRNRTGSGGRGGAIYNEGRLTIRRTLFEGNYSPQGAGAIYSAPGPGPAPSSLLVEQSIFRRNGVLDPDGPGRTLGQFGAIQADGATQVRGSLFHANEANYGAAVQSGAVLRIDNTTIVGNRTFQNTESGALLLGGPTRITSSTIVGNTGSTSGGLFVYPTSDTWLVNTIVADNLGTSPDIAGRVYSVGNNLIRSRTGSVVDGNVGANVHDVAPQLGPLQDNGGPTPTLALLPGSPARDAGSDCVLTAGACEGIPNVGLDTDQRGSGFPRKRGARVDIGASESAVLIVTNAANSGPGSLRQAVLDAAPHDVIGFDPVFFSQARTIVMASPPLVIAKPLTIAGPGVDLLTVDGNQATRHLNIDTGGQLTLSGMRFTRGNPGAGVSAGSILVNGGVLDASDIRIDASIGQQGGCLYNNGTVTLQRAVLAQCQANFAAAFFNESGKTATLRDVRIDGSSANGPGGGIGSFGTLVVERASISGNQAHYGAGLLAYGNTTLTNVTLSGNTATTAGGGGAYLGLTSTTAMNHVTITANGSAAAGGGITAEGGASIPLRNSVIAGNTSGGGFPDVLGVLTSQGHNLIGSSAGNSFAPGSVMTGVLVGADARLDVLADNGGFVRTHAFLFDSPLDDAGGGASPSGDARQMARPIDFTSIANAESGNGTDIGAFELQVNTPVDVVATPATGGLSVAFTGGANGGPGITSYLVRCGAQTATGTTSPILVGGLPAGIPVTCTVTASSGALTGIPSAPSASTTPGERPDAPVIGTAVAANGQASVAFTAPGNDGGSPITTYVATCGSRSAEGPSSPISVIGLVNGDPVQCRVAARNAVGTGPDSASSNTVTPGLPGSFAYVPKVGAASVSLVDLGTNTVVGNLGVSGGHGGVAVSPDGARVYLVSQSAGQVTVINTQTNAVTGTITVGPSPWSAVVSPDSSTVYVTNSGNSTVSVIDAATRTVTATIPVFNQPFGIAITPDGSQLYVANGGSAAVSVVDTATRAVVDTLTSGMNPIGVAVSPDGRRAYVTSQTQNNVTVFDVATRATVGTVAVGSNAYGVAVSRDSRRVIVGNASANTVSIIEAATLTVIATIPVGARPEGIDVAADGNRALVVNRDAGSISLIDLDTNVVTGTINLGGGSPFAMGRFVAVGGRTPEFTSAPLPAGVVGTPYEHVLQTAGLPRASFTVATGSLPPGLILDGDVIRGTPMAVGSGFGVIEARNGVAGTASQPFAITIGGAPPGPATITSVTPADGSVTIAFDPPTFTGGLPLFYNVFCSPGSGIVGVGSNSPLAFTGMTNGVTVTCFVSTINSAGYTVSAPSAPVTPGVAPQITSGALPPGTFGVSYQHTLTATGSPAPTFSIASGALPAGLVLDPVTGVISGTPTEVDTNGPATGTIAASNGIGTPATQAFSISIGGALPDAPTDVVATRGNASASVMFTAPANTGGIAIDQYTATCGAQTASGPTPPIIVGGLVNGVAVSCTVVATNAVGDSLPSAPSNSVVPATIPGAPAITGATPGNGSATVLFTAPAETGGSEVLDYRLRCSPAAGQASGALGSLTLTGLQNGVLHACTVSARNAVGQGPESASANVIPAAVLAADLNVSKTNGTGFVSGGEPTTWTIVVSNPGPAGVIGARVEDTLDADFSGASWTCLGENGGQCAASGSGNIDEAVDLPVGASVRFTLIAFVAPLPETPVSNLASVTPPNAIEDANLANNIASDGPDVRGIFRDGLE